MRLAKRGNEAVPFSERSEQTYHPRLGMSNLFSKGPNPLLLTDSRAEHVKITIMHIGMPKLLCHF
jgi:hypothetical protein